MGLDPSSSNKSQSLVEANSGLIIARDHHEHPLLTIHSFYACEPLRVGELGLLRIGGAECMRRILPRTKAYSFEDKSIQ